MAPMSPLWLQCPFVHIIHQKHILSNLNLTKKNSVVYYLWRNKMNKRLEAITAFTSVLGAVCISLQMHVGWGIWLVANLVGITWGIRSKNFYIAIMYFCYLISTFFGIWNYILNPYVLNS